MSYANYSVVKLLIFCDMTPEGKGGGIPGVFGGGQPPGSVNPDLNTSFSISLSDLVIRVSKVINPELYRRCVK